MTWITLLLLSLLHTSSFGSRMDSCSRLCRDYGTKGDSGSISGRWLVGELNGYSATRPPMRPGPPRPNSACPGRRPYVFYCDPADRTSPINQNTGQPWPKYQTGGMYGPPPGVAPPPDVLMKYPFNYPTDEERNDPNHPLNIFWYELKDGKYPPSPGAINRPESWHPDLDKTGWGMGISPERVQMGRNKSLLHHPPPGWDAKKYAGQSMLSPEQCAELRPQGVFYLPTYSPPPTQVQIQLQSPTPNGGGGGGGNSAPRPPCTSLLCPTGRDRPWSGLEYSYGYGTSAVQSGGYGSYGGVQSGGSYGTPAVQSGGYGSYGGGSYGTPAVQSGGYGSYGGGSYGTPAVQSYGSYGYNYNKKKK